MTTDRLARRSRHGPIKSLTTMLLMSAAAIWPSASKAVDPLNYMTLDFGTEQTFLTGIRGDNIVGNYVIPGTSATGGLLYDSATGTWSPFPFATKNQVNYPGAVSASPYGPSFGSPTGILRVVGSYKVDGSPLDLGYIYDGAAAPGNELMTLVYPDPGTLFTIAHSNFGNKVVGNYDTGPLTGNAFIYDTVTGTYTTNNKPGEASTTAYGVWGDKIAGGYGAFGPDDEPGFEHGYIYDMKTDTWKTYDHPLAIFTHFEGITGAGRGDEYNLIADWVDVGGAHAAVLHVDADGNETWIPIAFPGATTTSVNSIHQNRVIGVYTDADGVHGFEVTIPGIYNPIHNAKRLETSTDGAPAVSAGVGDDVVNDGTIRTHGINSSGVRSESYGVIYNNGRIVATGPGGAAVEMHGTYGTLLNGGLLRAKAGGYAIRATGDADGTAVVNSGVIDGLVKIKAGADARFENSGWLGVHGPGAAAHHVISGTFAQTEAGVLALRLGRGARDRLDVLGSARLAGTLMPVFHPGDLSKTYRVLTAVNEITGTFDTLLPVGLPSFVNATLAYSDNDVDLSLEARIAQADGLSRNQRAVGGVFDKAFNTGGGIADGLNAALFGMTESDMSGLDLLSGEIYASEQTVLFDQAMSGRNALLDRIRQATRAGPPAPDMVLGYAGEPVVAPAAPDPAAPGLWAQVLGSWGSIDASKNTAKVSANFGGFVGGADFSIGNDWILGLAFGYSQANTQIKSLSSSADVDTGLIAAYAGKSVGAWKVRTGAAYGLNFIDSKRSVSFGGFSDNNKADYRAGTTQVFGEVGYNAEVQGVSIEPFAGLAWVHLQTDSFKESGGAAALNGSGGASDVGYATIGFRAAVDHAVANGMVLTPRVSVAWQSAFGDLTPTAALAFAGMSGSNFTVTGAPVAGNTALIDAGVDLGIGPNTAVGLSYLGQISSTSSSNAVWGSYNRAF